MSRLNYLTEQELALDGIDRELCLLERLIADDVPLHGAHLQCLAAYRDRLARLVERSHPITSDQADDLPPVQPSSPSVHKAASSPAEPESIIALRESIRKCLDEGVIPDIAVAANPRAGQHVGERPDSRAGANEIALHERCRMDVDAVDWPSLIQDFLHSG